MPLTAKQLLDLAVNGNRCIVVQTSPRVWQIARPTIGDWEFKLDDERFNNPNDARREAAIQNGYPPKEL